MRNLEEIINAFEQDIANLSPEIKDKKKKHFYRKVRTYEANLDSEGRIINSAAMNLRAYHEAQRNYGHVNQSQDRNTNGDWELISPPTSNLSAPHQGRVLRLVGHPTNPNTIFAGCPDGGLWRSTNQGNTWTNLMQGFINLGISGIVVRANNPNVIYVLTGDGDAVASPSSGIFKTTNGGVDWVETSLYYDEANDLHFGNKLKAHPMNPNIMFAAMSNGLYKTTDSWISNTPIYSSGYFRDIEFAPGSMDTMYVCTNKEFYRSTNGGNSFQHITQIDDIDPNSDPSRLEIAIAPSHPHIVYVVMAWNTDPNGGTNGHRELYRSLNYGQTFTLISEANDLGKQSSSNLALAVDPGDASKLILGAVPSLRSTTWGLTFSNIQSGQNGTNVHADVHDVLFHGGELYLGTDGGVSRSSDLGNNWTDASYGLAITQFTDIDVHNNTFLGGTQDNGTLKWNMGASQATRPLGGDGFECQFDRNDPNIYYASTQHDRFRYPGQITITPSNQTNTWDASWTFHPTRTDTSYVCSKFIMRTYNKGVTWDSLNANLPSNKNIRAMGQGISNPNVMYVSDRTSIAYTGNIHASTPVWTQITDPFDLPDDARWWLNNIGSIAVDPDHSGKVWITFWGYEEGEKVYYSSNWGQSGSWTNVSGSLPNVPIRCSKAVPGPNDGIYVGTDIGVFYKDNTLSDWIWFGNGLPKSRIEDMTVSGGYLYIGTYGRGAWRSPLYNTCPISISLTQASNPDPNGMAGVMEFSASASILSNRIIYGGVGTDISFSAGDYITLYQGFTAKSNSTFVAKLDGCPD